MRLKLQPYGVVLKVPADSRFSLKEREMTVRIWAKDRDDAKIQAVDIYGGEAISAALRLAPLA